MSKTNDSFELKVDNCRKNESDELIQNAAWDHAVYLFKNLLEVAAEKKESVRLISGHLNNKFYSELSDVLQKCIDANVKFELIVLDDEIDEQKNNFLQILQNYHNGEVYILPAGYKFSAPHMLLVGDKAKRFRLETDHSQTKAVASFNNSSVGESLLAIYADVKDMILKTAQVEKSKPVAVS